MLAQLHDQVVRLGLLGLLARPVHRGDEELRVGVAAELMAQHAERAGAVAKGVGDLLGGVALKKIGPKGLIHALAGMGRLGEKPSALC